MNFQCFDQVSINTEGYEQKFVSQHFLRFCTVYQSYDYCYMSAFSYLYSGLYYYQGNWNNMDREMLCS